MIHLKLAPGRRVRDPKTKKLLDEKGVKIAEMDTYWHRRIVDGDVVVADAEQAPKPAAIAKAKPQAAKPKEDPKEKGV